MVGSLGDQHLRQELMPTLYRKKVALRDRLRPRRIILVRHGQSEGNKDSRAYETWRKTENPAGPLT